MHSSLYRAGYATHTHASNEWICESPAAIKPMSSSSCAQMLRCETDTQNNVIAKGLGNYGDDLNYYFGIEYACAMHT